MAYIAAITASHCRNPPSDAPSPSVAARCTPKLPRASLKACQSWSSAMAAAPGCDTSMTSAREVTIVANQLCTQDSEARIHVGAVGCEDLWSQSHRSEEECFPEKPPFGVLSSPSPPSRSEFRRELVSLVAATWRLLGLHVTPSCRSPTSRFIQ